MAHKFLNRSIWPINWTLTGTTTMGQSGLGCNGNKGYSTFAKPPKLEPRQQMQFSVIFSTEIYL